MRNIIAAFLLTGCAATNVVVPDGFSVRPLVAGDFTLMTWQKITDANAPVRIYIEGDGHAFDGHGRPTDDPTPHGRVARDLASRDASANVVYIARPCQFIMSPTCGQADWTTGRFSGRVVDAVGVAIKTVSDHRPVSLVGYSGGAYLAAAVIRANPDLNVSDWITVAGVLNHADWTEYFGDSPLSDSVPLHELPQLPARHYVAPCDTVVPNSLSEKWTMGQNLISVPGASHNDFSMLNIDKI